MLVLNLKNVFLPEQKDLSVHKCEKKINMAVKCKIFETAT